MTDAPPWGRKVAPTWPVGARAVTRAACVRHARRPSTGHPGAFRCLTKRSSGRLRTCRSTRSIEVPMSAPAAMRVALLTQQISPYHAARYRVARREFAELRVFSLMNSADFDELLSRVPDFDNVVRMFDGKSPYTRAVLTGALWSRLHEKLDECKPDVIVVAGWSFSESLAAIAWARKTGARVALMSDSQQHDAVRSGWREAIKRRVVSACDAALVAAGPHREYACSLGIPLARVFFGYDAADNQYFAPGADLARGPDLPLRTAHGLPQRYLMASGRFVAKKN